MAKQRRVIDVDVYEEDKQNTANANVNAGTREPGNENNNGNDGNMNFNNIDFNQMAKMFQNVDLGQLSSLLGGLGNGGGNGGGGNGLGALLNGMGGANGLGGLLNSLGGSGLGGLLGNLGGGGLGGLLGNMAGMFNGAPQKPAGPAGAGMGVPNPAFGGDKRLEILGALRPMMSPERAALIDMIMQLYLISKIIRR